MQPHKTFNIAVILASGEGSRFGSYDVPKQFVRLAGKPIIAYSLKTFMEHPRIDGIVVVAKERFHAEIGAMVKEIMDDTAGDMANAIGNDMARDLTNVMANDLDGANTSAILNSGGGGQR